MSTAVLRVDGTAYEGWLSLRCERSIERAAGAFEIELTERSPGRSASWVIEPGAECAFELDGHTAVTGSVDRSQRGISKDAYRVSVSGRDATADLIDCSACRADGSVGEINGLKLDALARTLAKGFKVGVKVDAGLDLGAAFSTWSIEPGESIFECIERAARQRAVLLMCDGRNNLVITRGGTDRHPIALVEGDNVLEASVTRDDSQRHHTYIALGQSSLDGGTSANAKSTDKAVRAPRRLIVVAEDLATGVTLKDRIIWERTIRRARGRTVEVTVEGFSAGGVLWSPNQRVTVKLPTLGIDAELLISSVSNSLGKDGAKSALSLIPPDALSLLPEASKSTGLLQ